MKCIYFKEKECSHVSEERPRVFSFSKSDCTPCLLAQILKGTRSTTKVHLVKGAKK